MRTPTNLFPTSRIYFIHLRYEDEKYPDQSDPRGGITVAFRHVLGTHWEIALAKCNVTDNFCKKVGRTIASNRLNCGDCHRIPSDLKEDRLAQVEQRIREWCNGVVGEIPPANLLNSQPTIH
jgi:hypothetical protein